MSVGGSELGVLVAVEGLDGAGKNTLTTALTAGLGRRGLRVARLGFPRYGRVHADLAADALHGRLPGVADSPEAMALLFALDRRDAATELAALRAAHDVVLLDRWVASNAAYTGARLGDVAGAAGWIAELEFDRFGVPRPDLHLLLATPPAVAAERAGRREVADAARTRDRYERDAELQHATGRAYAELAAAGWACRWEILGVDPDPDEVCDTVCALTGAGTPGG